MKKIFILFTITIGGILISAFSTNNAGSNSADYVDFKGKLTIPENIQGILDNSCMGCHNSESHNTKAKMKLKFDELESMSVSKQVSKLNKIVKMLKKGKMPPEKTVAKYPDMALNPDAKSELLDWAKSTSQDLMK